MAERFSRHAEERAAQRNLSYEDLALVMLYGQKLHRAAALYIFIERRDVTQRLKGN